jgi:GTP-binding protein
VDTAGQRKKSRVEEKIEEVAVLDAWKHIRQANVIVVLMDIQNPFEKQDITIARKAFDEGKIVIFALNKSDTVANPDEILNSIAKRAQKEFAQLPGVACLLVSGKEKKGLARIFNTSFRLYDDWSRRISTGTLNKWLQMAIRQNPPPLVNGLPIKLKYISQTNCKPPTFALFANRAEHLPVSYERYLLNNLRKSFSFDGVPLRIFLRQRENPYNK